MTPSTKATRPHVLLVGAEWFTERPGGLNRYLADLLAALSRNNVPATAVVLGPARDAPTSVVGAGSTGWSLLRRLLAVRRAAARAGRNADVVDVHFALYGLLPVLTTRLRRLPLVVHFQGPWADESALTRGREPVVLAVKRAVERVVYRRARAVVVLSEAFGRIVVDRYGVDPTRVHVIAPGVDLDRFCTGDQAVARAQFDLPSDAFVAVAARRLDPRMGLDVLLDAWSEVQRAHPDAMLLVVGDGAEWERLTARAAELPDPSRVRLLGRVSDEDLVRLYQAADCSVVPTRALEGFGLVTLESLACGTPAVVTDVGGLPDGVRGLDPSLVVLAEDAGALARRLLGAAQGLLPSRASCRAHAERFGWGEVARVHARLYEQVGGRAPLRVVYLDHTAELSGGELALARLVPALDAVAPHLILAVDGPLAGRLRTAGISVEVLPMPSVARELRRDRVRAGRLPLGSAVVTAAYVVRLARRLRRLRPDLVHTNSLKSAIYGGLAARLAGVPVVWHVHDQITEGYLPSGAVRLVRALARWVPAGIIANSRSTLDTLGPLRCPTAVVPSPIDPALLDRPRPPRGDRPFTVVMVGRLAPWKGQHVFLEAFARAFPGGPERALVVGGALFGETDYESEIYALTARLGLTDRVEFTGFTDDVAGQLDRADVLVHASVIPEPFGLVVVEGMAAGLPVIAADAGGPAEVITDGVDGILCPPGDIEALTTALQGLAADEDLGARLSANARARAGDFGPDRVSPSVTDLYRRVIGSPQRVGDCLTLTSQFVRMVATASRGYGQVARRAPLRVVYLDHSAMLSGGELALARLLLALDGVEPHVILAEDGPLTQTLRTAAISFEVLPMASVARELRRDRIRAGRLPLGSAVVTAAYVVRLARRLRRLRPHLVHTNSLKAAIYGGLAARLAGVPVVWHVRDQITEEYLPSGAVRLVRALARWVPAGIIANSRSTLDTLGPLPCPTAVVPSPIDPALLDRVRPPRGDRAFTVTMVGRLAPWKGQHVFLEAFARAFPGGPERALVVGGALFGETDYERELHALAARLGLTDRVEFTGFTDNVAGQLDRADVLVHASVIPEPFGLVVVEGMAAGLPVIAADAGGPAEVITDGVDGLLYPPGDVNALATALQSLAADAGPRGALSANARARAREFAPDRVAPNVTDLYRRAIGSTRRVGEGQ